MPVMDRLVQGNCDPTCQMCALKQLCAPCHDGRGCKNNGPGYRVSLKIGPLVKVLNEYCQTVRLVSGKDITAGKKFTVAGSDGMDKTHLSVTLKERQKILL